MDESKNHSMPQRRYSRSITVPVLGEVPLRLSDIITDLKIKEAPPLWAQLFKYGVFGLLGAALFSFCFALVEIFYPEYVADDLPRDMLKLHLLNVLVGAFLVSNMMAYITNRMFVFTPSGRSKWVEFGIFLFVTGVSFTAGNIAKDWIIDIGLHKYFAAFSFAFSTAVVNFITRKYLVFSDQKVVKPTGL